MTYGSDVATLFSRADEGTRFANLLQHKVHAAENSVRKYAVRER